MPAKLSTRSLWRAENTWCTYFFNLSPPTQTANLIIPQVRNEIAVLKKISKSHPNIVTLHDYFEVLSMSSR